jgi:hypothetical protein
MTDSHDETAATLQVSATIDPISLTPYGQLVTVLIPAAIRIAIHDEHGRMLWTSNGAESSEIGEALAQFLAPVHGKAPREEGVALDLSMGKAFLFLVKDYAGEILGAVVLECAERGSVAKGAGTLHTLLRPILEVLGRELRHHRSASDMQRDMHRRDRDLELLAKETAVGSVRNFV